MDENKTPLNPDLKVANELQGHLLWLDSFTPAALGVLSTASGIYTYLGVSTLLDNTGLLSSIAAIAYSIAVSVGIFVFWSYLLRLLPSMRTAKGYLGLSFAGIIGSMAIIAMSSWLNATALAGSAAIEQHLGKTITQYQKALEQANEIARRSLTLKEEVGRSAKTFLSLAKQEKEGNFSGQGGEGTVFAVLKSKGLELEQIEEKIKDKEKTIEKNFKTGVSLITKMQSLKSGSGPVDIRSLKFAEASINLSGIITKLLQSSSAPMVERAMNDLETFIVGPMSGDSKDLQEKQKTLIEQIKNKTKDIAENLRTASQEIMEIEPPKDTSYTSISSADAVIIYAENFYPQWAGAIAIDLLPAVLVFILAITQSVIRLGRKDTYVEDRMTVSDLKIAMRALKDVEKNFDTKGSK